MPNTWPITPDPVPAGLQTDEATQADVFGKDVFFDGRHRVTSQGDYQTVQGEDNLRRWVHRCLITRPGDYKLRPNFGVGMQDYVKKTRTKSTIDELTLRIKGQIARDRRVQKVLQVLVTEEQFGDDTGLKVVVIVQAFGRTLRPLAYSFKKEA